MDEFLQSWIDYAASDSTDYSVMFWPMIYVLVLVFVCSTLIVIVLYHYAHTLKPHEKKIASYPPDRLPHKQRLTSSSVPKEVDVIVVGSGMGGLSAAALLSRIGKKVLVLEQYAKAGGSTHVYEESGVPFDTGVHYLPPVMADKNNLIKVVMDMISAQPIEYTSMGDEFDVIEFRDGHETFKFRAGMNEWRQALVDRFPAEEVAIDSYIEAMRNVEQKRGALFMSKALPPTLAYFMGGGVDPMLSQGTMYDVLRKLTDNEELIAVLNGQYMNWGLPPKAAAFNVGTAVSRAYIPGGVYPIGGSEVYARNIVPVIEGAGGKVLVSATVDHIVTGSKGQVEGVVVKTKGGTEFTVRAPVVISAAGARVTYTKFVKAEALPKRLARKFHKAREAVERVPQSCANLSLFVTLKGSAAELKLPKSNVFQHKSIEMDADRDAYLSSPEYPRRADGKGEIPPTLFICFNSSKDSESFEAKYPGKSTCIVLGEAKWDWFKKWEGTESGKRDAEYKALKALIAEAMLEGLYRSFPHLKDHVEKVEVGTPLTNDFYIGSVEGAMYSLAFTPERFSTQVLEHLGPKTCVPGLYIAGQDVLSNGVTGAFFGGLAAACCVSWKVMAAVTWELSSKIKRKEKKNKLLRR